MTVLSDERLVVLTDLTELKRLRGPTRETVYEFLAAAQMQTVGAVGRRERKSVV